MAYSRDGWYISAPNIDFATKRIRGRITTKKIEFGAENQNLPLERFTLSLQSYRASYKIHIYVDDNRHASLAAYSAKYFGLRDIEGFMDLGAHGRYVQVDLKIDFGATASSYLHGFEVS